MWPFKCSHPFKYVWVNKYHTEKQIDADFINVDYHLICLKCGEELPIKYAKLVGGVNNFLRIGEQDNEM